MSVTRTEAVDLIKEIISEKPVDYKYQDEFSDNCMYQWKDEPACIVGHFLSRIGMLDQIVANGLNSTKFSSIVEDLPFDFDDDTVEFLQEMQDLQDSGEYTWNEALEKATQGVIG